MTGIGRYFRLFVALGRFSLAGEMAFRANFLVKVFVEVLWLAILLISKYNNAVGKSGVQLR